MSEVITTLGEKSTRALVALGMFRFVTTQQFIRLGVSKNENSLREKILHGLERRRYPLAENRKLGMQLPQVHYLTKYGAAELAEIYKVPVELIRYPKGKVQFGERLARHRFAQVDFHIGLRKWASSREDTRLTSAIMDFDIEGSRKSGNFTVPTQIDLPNNPRPVQPDGVFTIDINGHPIIYALEVHRTTQTRAVGMQIQRYMEVLETGALTFKMGLREAPAYVCSVHMKGNVLRGVKQYLLSNPNFAPYRDYFLFNTAPQIEADFLHGWHYADDQPAHNFPRAENTQLAQLLDDFDI